MVFFSVLRNFECVRAELSDFFLEVSEGFYTPRSHASETETEGTGAEAQDLRKTSNEQSAKRNEKNESEGTDLKEGQMKSKAESAKGREAEAMSVLDEVTAKWLKVPMNEGPSFQFDFLCKKMLNKSVSIVHISLLFKDHQIYHLSPKCECLKGRRKGCNVLSTLLSTRLSKFFPSSSLKKNKKNTHTKKKTGNIEKKRKRNASERSVFVAFSGALRLGGLGHGGGLRRLRTASAAEFPGGHAPQRLDDPTRSGEK